MRIWPRNRIYSSLLNHLRQATTRHNADETVAAINSFAGAHGRYPATLDEIGIDRRQVRDKLGSMSGYSYDKGQPHLGYPDTFTPFGYCGNDFAKSSWRCLAD